MRYTQAPVMDISAEEIKAAFGRVCASKPGEALYGSIYQVLFLPSQLDTPLSTTHYTAFCPFTGIMGRGSTMAQAYKAWLAEASLVLGFDIRSLFSTDSLSSEDLTSRKLSVGEILASSKSTMVPVFVIDVVQSDSEVIVCPYKAEVGTADKNSNLPVLSCDGKEMKVPGFIMDHRVKCTRISRFPTSASSLSTIIPSANVTATLV